MNFIPKTHLIAASSIALLIAVIALWVPSPDVNATRITIPLTPEAEKLIAAPSVDDKTGPETSNHISTITNSSPAPLNKDQPAQAGEAIDVNAFPTTQASELDWKVYKVKSGDTLSTLFSKAGFNDRKMYDVLYSDKQNKALAKIYPKQTLSFGIAHGELQEIKLQQDPFEYLSFNRNSDGKYDMERVQREPEIHIAFAEGEIESSLYLAGYKAGMSDNQIMDLAGIFGWDIDFVLDIRTGDTFNFIYEELYLDGEKIRNGNILAANFTNQGKTFTAVRFKQGNGFSHYFTPDGKSMRKAFLRTPVDFARISSHFNLRRKHPVLHKIRAHRGTDYAAARGTPIKASGDGKVIHAARKGGYGHTVILQHGQNITTLYAHMSKYGRGIKRGKRVKQGQIIGYIGSSGLATGPHLHYEFRVNGVHKNPVKVKLPQANPVPKTDVARFKSETQPLLAQLKTYNESYRLAANE